MKKLLKTFIFSICIIPNLVLGVCQFDVSGACTEQECIDLHNGYTPVFFVDNVCERPPSEAFGCTNPNSYNYNSSAYIDDGSCTVCSFYPTGWQTCSALGCSNLWGSLGEVKPAGLIGTGHCYAPTGCVNPDSYNINPFALYPDNTCKECIPNTFSRCSNVGCENLSEWGTYVFPGKCEVSEMGCTDPDSNNYNSDAALDDGSCNVCTPAMSENCSQSACSDIGFFWDGVACVGNTLGCTDPLASNFNPTATVGNTTDQCYYCSSSDLRYCVESAECMTAGGFWEMGTCTDGQSTLLTTGEMSFVTPQPGSSYSFSQSVPSGYNDSYVQSCISYNSSNVCDGWRTDISDDLFEFLINLAYKVAIYILVFGLGFFIIFKVFGYISLFFRS